VEQTANSPRNRREVVEPIRAQRSRITNRGARGLPGVDGRSPWVRRLKDVLREHSGDRPNATAAEIALLQRAATLIVELERREAAFALAGEVTDNALMVYQTAVNTLRRTLEAIGLERRARDVTPSLRELLVMTGAAGNTRPQSSYGRYRAIQ
jgi:hypothetical protein